MHMKQMGWVITGIAGAIAFCAVLYFALLFVAHDFDPDFLSIDRCLDSGGRWNSEGRVCEREPLKP